MNISLKLATIRTRRTTEKIYFSDSVTFLYGPVGTGKSTVARLIDYCFGGSLERTPAIQQEFVSVVLTAALGDYECTFERGAEDTQSVRVSWSRGDDERGSINAPLSAGGEALLEAEVFNLSDLIFYLCNVEPIKVLKRSQDPDSPTVRLSFRDLWWYCYLDQTHLDSSFFRLEDPLRGRKSQDAMRFFTGLHSERLSQLQSDLYRAVSEQQGSRRAVEQIRSFISRFNFGSEAELEAQIAHNEAELKNAIDQKRELETGRAADIHPTDKLRDELRELSRTVSGLREAVYDSLNMISQQESLRAELITSKIKAGRAEKASEILKGVDYCSCPQCGADISHRPHVAEKCRLCGTFVEEREVSDGGDSEDVRREINDRIDQISDSIKRRRLVVARTRQDLDRAEREKSDLDLKLRDDLSRYDSSFVESIRKVDSDIAMLQERRLSLEKLREMPRAISDLEEMAGALQGRIDRIRSAIDDERNQLRSGDDNARCIANKFKSIMLDIGFPGVMPSDDVILDPRNWKPNVVHSDQRWGFWDTGSGGKKTLFNVCYALAVHAVARERSLPVPSVLIVDSPTKNISDEENPELVESLYREIYELAAKEYGGGTQFLLIDSDLIEPGPEFIGFSQRRMAGEPEAPSLISYYDGP